MIDVTDEEIVAAIDRGVGRNRIAADMGVSRRRVSAVAAAHGRTFARAVATRAATAARSATTVERRHRLVDDLLGRAERALEDLDRLAPPVDALDVERRARVLASVGQTVAATVRTGTPEAAAPTIELRQTFDGFLAAAATFAAASGPDPLDALVEYTPPAEGTTTGSD